MTKSLEHRLELYFLVRQLGGPGASSISDQPRSGGDPTAPAWLIEVCELGCRLEALPVDQRAAVEGRWTAWLEEQHQRRREDEAHACEHRAFNALTRACGDPRAAGQLGGQISAARAQSLAARRAWEVALGARFKWEAMQEYDLGMATLRQETGERGMIEELVAVLRKVNVG